MAHSVTHKFVSAIPDGTDPNLIKPSNWNDSHDITIDLSDNAHLSNTLAVSKLAANTISGVTLGGNLATLTHGNGIASLSYNGTANVTVGLQTLTNDGTGSFVKINRDTYGRIAGTTPVTSGDITGLVNFPNITAGKTFAVTNSLTLSGTDGSTLNVGAGGTLGSNAYTSTSYEPAISKATGYATWNGSAWVFVNETYSLSTHDHTGVYSPVHSHPYEPTITKATGYAKWNGSAWVFVDETYSLSGHTHSYEPANANIQSHISNTSNPHSVTKSQVGLGNVLDVAQEPAITKATGYVKWNGSAWAFVNETYSLSTHDHTGVYEAANANIQSHISSTSNPHSVTANQVLPNQSTHSGKYLTTDGNNVSWATVVGGGGGSTTYSITNIIATLGQTVFSVAYTVGYLDVYHNGVRLLTTDFTASNGTSVTLGSAAELNDELVFVAWNLGAVQSLVAAGAIYENSNVITSDYTISAGKNAVSAGPIEVGAAAIVTIPAGSVWTIV